jgi:hypothetical protein
LLDLSALSGVEPEFDPADKFDKRPNHFSKSASPFMCDLIGFSISKTDFVLDKKVVVDFRPYVNRDSKWQHYLNAFATIKKDLL